MQLMMENGDTPVHEKRAWYCLRTQPRREHIVAGHLRSMEDVEAFLPRIRFQRATRKGPAWVTEPLFPGYLFTRFDLCTSLRRVQSANGARGIVHFGLEVPAVPGQIVADLRQTIGANELLTIATELTSGDAVYIAEGTLRGLRAIVSRVIPGRERVAVLMELLGQQTEVELTTRLLIKEGDKRQELLF